MALGDLLARIPSDRRAAFERFVSTGEADEAFLKYLDTDAEAQSVSEAAFTEEAKGFEILANALRVATTNAKAVAKPAEARAMLKAAIAKAEA